MNSPESNPAEQPVPQTTSEQETPSLKPWVKPTFEQAPLNGALANLLSGPGSTDLANLYAS